MEPYQAWLVEEVAGHYWSLRAVPLCWQLEKVGMIVEGLRVRHTSPPDHGITGDLLEVGGPVPVWVEVYMTFAVAVEA